MQTSIMEDVISPAASFTSQRSTKSIVPGTEAFATSESESQAGTQLRSRTQTRSQSHEDEAEGAASSAAVAVAAEGNQGMPAVAAREVDAAGGEPTFEWGAGTRDSEMTSLGMTGRSASSRTITQRRKVRGYQHFFWQQHISVCLVPALPFLTACLSQAHLSKPRLAHVP